MARKARRASESTELPAPLKHVHLHAAGIDVGAEFHMVAVPEGSDPEPVRQFSSFTEDLIRVADWLKACHVDTVAMESTGVYWIPLYEMLDRRGFRVYLVSPKHLKSVPGRKSDVADCQWLQQLHTFGLLTGAFRPDDQEVVLRSYMRQRAMLVEYAGKHIQHMQKALTQMNVLVHQAVTDTTGATGMRIIRAILAGERNPQELAAMRDANCKKDAATIAKALQGNWRDEHLFALRQAVELWDFYRNQIQGCDAQILAHLQTFEDRSEHSRGTPPTPPDHKPRKNEMHFDAGQQVYRMTGSDLTKIKALQGHTALLAISEIGRDVSHWPTAKHFASWLRLAPSNRISGGKRLPHRKMAPTANRLAQALRVAAATIHHSSSYIGAYYRRLAARVGKEKAIKATARKLAEQLYYALKYGNDFVDRGEDYYERTYRARALKNLKRQAKQFGFRLVQEAI